MATIRPTGYLAHYGFSEEDVLEHYGVKGMKWGKRKKAQLNIQQPKYSTLGGQAISSKANFNSMYNVAREGVKGFNRTHELKGDGGYAYLLDDPSAMSASKSIVDGFNRTNKMKFEKAKANAEKAQADGIKKTASEKTPSAIKKASVAALKGKAKVRKLLKAADASWNKSRARDTVITTAHKASDVVEAIRNKDGSISYKKKKKS